jgi:superfamily II DNA or RNA helicase
MKDKREAVEHHVEVACEYNKILYRTVKKDRWNPYDKEPIAETGKHCYLERRVANEDASRIVEMTKLLEDNKRTIIFYNFDYELEILRNLPYGLDVEIAEWNGHKHEPVPDAPAWIYLVQYSAGCEGWNCTETDTIIFFSRSYSYKQTEQAAGRIDRLNTPFMDLYYYVMTTDSPIDNAIEAALKSKKDFNEKMIKW